MNNENKIAVLIKKLSLEIDKLSNPILEPYDLTNSQFKILKFLLNSPENSIRQVDVEKYFSMTNPTVTGLVQTLEKKGLIERKINPNDSRSKILCPTEKTMKMKNLLYKLGDELEKKFTSVLNPDEKKTLMQLLKKLLHK
ncbi:MAG: MarR family transcriptional regulator [Synergistaceae bacterium]|nr:MarR family transcriptional regulator [Synergistaceae bacterium]MBR0074151.1 MarR family transcriptional regulator [Synergistaceae bacterium]MBR0317031.1 MarR family transcriptional regulator [Synergistaceae bacterium]